MFGTDRLAGMKPGDSVRFVNIRVSEGTEPLRLKATDYTIIARM